MVALWTSGATQNLVIGIAVLWMAICAHRSWRTVRDWGLSGAGFRESAWVVLVTMLIAGALLATASLLHTLHLVVRGHSPATSIATYTAWALLQQFILLNIFLARLLRIFQSRVAAVVATGALFAIAHIPNPLLIAITLTWGSVSGVLFLRYRNLYVLALAHAIVGLTLGITVPDAVQHQMRVGIGYWHWHAPPPSTLSKPQ
jgi:membrane protease YdiL (CAAX protease family)